MNKILIIGGTGYAGAFIAKEARKRNNEVVALSRSQPTDPIAGVEYVQGSASDAKILSDVMARADVVVATVSPRGNMAGQVAPLYAAIAKLAAEHNVRFIVVGGFSTLRPVAGAQRFFEDGSIPAEYRDEALELAAVLESLDNDTPQDLDWLFISPAAVFGAHAGVVDTGTYTLGGDVAIFDKNGESKISGADFAIGVVDEIENRQHHKVNISLVQA